MVLEGCSILGRLSNRLNIDKERVAILLLHLYKIAIDVWRNKKDVLVIDRVNEILEVAESKEEAYLLGLLTAIIHNTMVFAVDYSYNYEMFDTLAILDTLKPKNLRAKR